MVNSDKSQVLGELCRILSPRKKDGLTDGQLLEKYLTNRDERAFEALVRRHGAMVLGVCHRVLGHAQDAEDAYQATFLVLARKAARCVPREAVGNWLYGIAYFTAHKARVAAARRKVKEKQMAILPEIAAKPEENWRELVPLLDGELSRLPDKYRLPVVLCELEGRTRGEVARQLGLPEGTLSSRLATARKRLARQLAKHRPLLSSAALGSLLSEGGTSAAMSAPLVKAVVLAAAGKAAVPARVAALVQGALKTMFMAKLKAVTCGLVLIASAGAAGLKYQTMTAELQEEPQPAPPGVARDELDALRLEMAALRKDLQGMRQRVRSLEGELHVLKAERPASGAMKAPTRPAPLPGQAPGAVPEIGGVICGEPEIGGVINDDSTRPAPLPGQAPGAVPGIGLQSAQAEAEVALKRLREHPGDQKAINALRRAVERLKQGMAQDT